MARDIIEEEKTQFKAAIVNLVDAMLKRAAQEQKGDFQTLTDEERIRIANLVADAYITGVYDFLTTHPGARPKLGSRFPWEDEYNCPVCDDWAGGIEEYFDGELRNTWVLVGGKWRRLRDFVRWKWVQYNTEPEQHNFVIVFPGGLEGQLQAAIEKGKSADENYLIFYPWHTVLPWVYRPCDGETVLPNTWGFGPEPIGWLRYLLKKWAQSMADFEMRY